MPLSSICTPRGVYDKAGAFPGVAPAPTGGDLCIALRACFYCVWGRKLSCLLGVAQGDQQGVAMPSMKRDHAALPILQVDAVK